MENVLDFRREKAKLRSFQHRGSNKFTANISGYVYCNKLLYVRSQIHK